MGSSRLAACVEGNNYGEGHRCVEKEITIQRARGGQDLPRRVENRLGIVDFQLAVEEDVAVLSVVP